MSNEHTNEEAAEQQNDFTPIESQEDFDKRIQARIQRAVKSAESKFSDYEELREKAAQLDAIKEGEKTDIQKKDDTISSLEKERDGLLNKIAEHEAAQLRYEVASEKGVPAALLSGSTREALEESADALLDWRTGAADVNRRQGTGSPEAKISSLSTGRERARGGK